MQRNSNSVAAGECVNCGALVFGRATCFLRNCGGAVAPLTPAVAIRAAERLANAWTERAAKSAPFLRFTKLDPPSHLEQARDYREAQQAIGQLRAVAEYLRA